MKPGRQPPPPGVVAAAEQDYHFARDQLDELIIGVEVLLAGGVPEIETVTELWTTLRAQRDEPAVLLLCAAAILRLAATPQPPAAGDQPHAETR